MIWVELYKHEIKMWDEVSDPHVLQPIFKPSLMNLEPCSGVCSPALHAPSLSLLFPHALYVRLCVALLANCNETFWAQILLFACSASHHPAYPLPQICCPKSLVNSTKGWCCCLWSSPATFVVAWNGTRSSEWGQSIRVCRKWNCHGLPLLLW